MDQRALGTPVLGMRTEMMQPAEPQPDSPLGPIQWLRLLPPEHGTASSDRLRWVGLEAGGCRATPAFELNLPALTHHRPLLFAPPPEELRPREGGRGAAWAAPRRLGLALAGRHPGPGALERVQGRAAPLPGAGACVAGGGRGVRPRPGAAGSAAAGRPGPPTGPGRDGSGGR